MPGSLRSPRTSRVSSERSWASPREDPRPLTLAPADVRSASQRGGRAGSSGGPQSREAGRVADGRRTLPRLPPHDHRTLQVDERWHRGAEKRAHGAFDFPDGTLLLTEQSTKKRASLHVVQGEEALAELDPGGIDVLAASPAAFAAALTSENRTLKRALTDPRVFSGSATHTRTRSCSLRDSRPCS